MLKESRNQKSNIPNEMSTEVFEGTLVNQIRELQVSVKYDLLQKQSVLHRYNDKILIVHSSQTGTATRYAQSLKKYLNKCSIDAMAANISAIKMNDLFHLADINTLVVFIVSTYGCGQPPDDGFSFNEWLKSSHALPAFKFTVFALGDSSYEKFACFGELIFKRLRLFGALNFMDIHFGDAKFNQESSYIKWRSCLVEIINSEFNFPTVSFNVSDLYDFKITLHTINADVFVGEVFKKGSVKNQKKPYHAKNPLLASILQNDEICKSSKRSCRLISFNIENSALRYEPGDHLGVYPSNDSATVDELAELLKIDLDQIISLNNVENNSTYFPCPCSVRTALTYYLDIVAPVSIDMLLNFLGYAEDGKDKDFISLLTQPSQTDLYNKWVIGECRNIVSLLRKIPSLKIPLHVILESLPRLTCRYYSIASSPQIDSKSVQIAVMIVDWISPSGNLHHGLASNYLKNLNPLQIPNAAPIFIRKALHFHLPPKPNIPLILIGCGVGIAPYRGFLQHRSASSKIGNTAIFYGCRNKLVDYLFQEEFKTFMDRGILTHLFTCFSRDSPEKHYITENIIENAQIVFDYLEKGGYVYICGSSKILFNIQSALHESIRVSSKWDEEKVKNYIINLKQKGRYCVDVW